jgi:hypothetical protein
MKALISHIRNEEYMLQWWIPHHLQKFDEVVIINYGSTDNTVDMIREMAPHWHIVDAWDEKFDCFRCDEQIFSLEQQIQQQYPGTFTIALTITEFLVGNTKFLDRETGRHEKYILACQMCDRDEEMYVEPDPNIPLIKQRTFGYPEFYDETVKNDQQIYEQPIWKNFETGEYHVGWFSDLKVSPRYQRCIRNGAYSTYDIGRHYWRENIERRLKIACYYYSPITKKMIERKCRVQDNLNQQNIDDKFAYQHVGLTEETILRRMKHIRSFGRDLREEFEWLENLTFSD